MRSTRGCWLGTRQRFPAALNPNRPDLYIWGTSVTGFLYTDWYRLCISSTFTGDDDAADLVLCLVSSPACTFCLSQPTLLWLLVSPDRYNGKVILLHSALHLARVWLFEPLRASEFYFFHFLFVFVLLLHCLLLPLSFVPASTTLLCAHLSVFSGLYRYWVGPLPFVLVLLDSTFLFSRVGTRAYLSITYPSPSFELFFFLFHDVVHAPSPFFPISTSRHLPRPSNSPTPAGFGGWPTLLRSIAHHCFITALATLSPRFGIRHTDPPSNLHTSAILWYGATPLPHHLTIFYILYRPSLRTHRILLFSKF